MSEEQTEVGTITALSVVRADALKEITAVEAGIADLTTKYKDVVFDCKTASGMADAKVARAAIRDPRYAVERARKAKKSELAQIGKEVDSKAAEVTAALKSLEDPIDAQIKIEEDRKEREKLQKAEDERRRTGAIRAMIEAIRNTECAKSVPALEIAIMNLSVMEISEERFHEFLDEAVAVREATVERLKAALEDQQEIERQREELRAQAEAQRLAAEQLAIERQKIQAERDEQDRIRREQQAKEDAERAAKQAEEDAKREAERQRQAYLDGLQGLVVRASTAESVWIEHTLDTMERRPGCEAAVAEADRSLRTILVAARKLEAAAAVEAERKAQEAAEAEKKKAAEEAERARVAQEQAEREAKIKAEQEELARQQEAFAAQKAKEAQDKLDAEAAELVKRAPPASLEERLAALQAAVHAYLNSDMMNLEVRRAGLVALKAALAISRSES